VYSRAVLRMQEYMQFRSLFMVEVYVCYAMTCIGLRDIWVRVTHELYGDLGITSGQYASRDSVW
jgi:hypothetical protein